MLVTFNLASPVEHWCAERHSVQFLGGLPHEAPPALVSLVQHVLAPLWVLIPGSRGLLAQSAGVCPPISREPRLFSLLHIQ